MRIRCERCATTYELDERRLPRHGALVKCTRCDHVFRAAPPGAGAEGAPDPGADPSAPERPAAEDRTALYGFPSAAEVETTAPLTPPARAAGPAASSGPARAREGKAVAVTRPAAREPAARSGRSTWIWVLIAALLLAALLAGWWTSQRKAATPTTRLPAGAELFPT